MFYQDTDTGEITTEEIIRQRIAYNIEHERIDYDDVEDAFRSGVETGLWKPVNRKEK